MARVIPHEGKADRDRRIMHRKGMQNNAGSKKETATAASASSLWPASHAIQTRSDAPSASVILPCYQD